MVSETEQALVRESAETARWTAQVQETMDNQKDSRWQEAEAQLRDMRESISAQAQQFAGSK